MRLVLIQMSFVYLTKFLVSTPREKCLLFVTIIYSYREIIIISFTQEDHIFFLNKIYCNIFATTSLLHVTIVISALRQQQK